MALEPSKVRLKNHIAKAAIAESFCRGSPHNPNELFTSLYSKWAKGGTTLIITGHMFVDRNHTVLPQDPVLDKDSNLSLFKSYAESCALNNCKVVVQLNHPGRQVPESTNKSTIYQFYSNIIFRNVVSVSDVKVAFPGFVKPRPLSEEEIKRLIKLFGESAQLTKDIGFNGVEIHGAHGYLISQFLSPKTNPRLMNTEGVFRIGLVSYSK